ncbi:MAG TPA: acyl-CoA dehydrogenase [Candidatus Udaeobacter sp.]|nr:acyl-CoA dehydrogenase [Candidatus Udaeobacter sp.]
MDFQLTDEQRMIRDAARDLAEREIKPRAQAVDETREFPLENVRRLGENGFMGMCVDPAYDGAGLDFLSYILALEEVCAACAATGVIMSVQNSLVCGPIERFGSEDQKRRYLSGLATGKLIGAYCLTEPQAGSDAANQRTTAVKDGDHYVLNGTKMFVTNGGAADVLVVYTRTDPAAKSRGITAFLVETKTPGVERSHREKTMGIRGSSTMEIVFKDARVPAANLLGELNRGYSIALSTLEGGRIGIAAQAIGIARNALSEALKYAQEREQFGHPIAEFQSIQWMLADMATEVSAAQLLTYRAAVLRDHGERCAKEASIAKLYASEVAVRCADRAVQVHGGYGYIQDFPVERLYRDAKITQLYEGTSQVQRMVIASNLLKGE